LGINFDPAVVRDKLVLVGKALPLDRTVLQTTKLAFNWQNK